MRLQRDLQQAVRSRQLSVSDSVRPQGQGMPVERLYGIIIRGSPDVDDIVNKSKAQEIFDFMRDGLGARGYLEDLVSTTADPLTRGKVERAIHRLSHLRECDKFFLMTSGHGNGEDRYFDLGGAEDMRWSKLCAIISKNIRAGRICIVADNCHSGNIHEVFKNWPLKPGQKVVLVSTTTAAGASTAGLSGPCVLDAILRRLKQLAGPGGKLTPELIGQAMAGVQVSKEELLAKFCDWLTDPESPDGLVQKQLFQTTLSQPQVSELSGPDPGPPPAPVAPTVGVTEDIRLPGTFIGLINQWLGALEQGQSETFRPLYDPNYNYAGRNLAQILNQAQGRQIDVQAALATALVDSDSVTLVRTQSHTPNFEIDENAEYAHRAEFLPGIGLRFTRQAKIRWWVEQHKPGSVLLVPPPPRLESLTVEGRPVLGLLPIDDLIPDFGQRQQAPGSTLHLILQTRDFQNRPATQETAQAGASVAGQSFSLNLTAPDRWEGNVLLPVAPGTYRMDVFAFSTITNGLPSSDPNFDSTQSSAGRSQEVEVR
jgi:hypothetical protein